MCTCVLDYWYQTDGIFVAAYLLGERKAMKCLHSSRSFLFREQWHSFFAQWRLAMFSPGLASPLVQPRPHDISDRSWPLVLATHVQVKQLPYFPVMLWSFPVRRIYAARRRAIFAIGPVSHAFVCLCLHVGHISPSMDVCVVCTMINQSINQAIKKQKTKNKTNKTNKLSRKRDLCSVYHSDSIERRGRRREEKRR